MLFGHRKGAFSSADGDVSGLLQHCDGGTLVLDDVDALEPPQQMILLRFLDTGLAAPVSAPERERRLDVRIIATTNHDLSQQARCTRFRDDFFYRLAQFHVRVPPLRERSGGFRDVLAQIEAELRAEFGPDYRGVDAGVAGLLGLDPWPGNFRELRAYLRGLFILGDPDRRGPITLKELHSVAREEIGLREPLDRLKARAREEPDLVRRVLQLAGGNKTLAAGLLGYSRETIHEKIRQHRWKI